MSEPSGRFGTLRYAGARATGRAEIEAKRERSEGVLGPANGSVKTHAILPAFATLSAWALGS